MQVNLFKINTSKSSIRVFGYYFGWRKGLNYLEKGICPPGPCQKEGEDDGPIKDPTINGRISIGFMIFGYALENGVSVSRWECCRRLQSERGQDSPGKAKCEGEVEKQRAGVAVHSGKTPNGTGPDSHHSS